MTTTKEPMMLFEITNPSDPYTMRTDSFAAALMAVAILGEGRYGIECLDNKEVPKVYPMFFGEWPSEIYAAAGVSRIIDLLQRADDDPVFNEAVAAALDSVRVGGRYGRRVEDKAEHDRYRSSINDIGRYAWKYAEAMRGKRRFSEVDAVNEATK